VNASGRRYCRACGGRLGAHCPACAFFNGFDDAFCGRCARRLKAAGPLAEDASPASAYSPALSGDMGVAEVEPAMPAVAGSDAEIAAQEGVSQSEIDGLFENILDEEPGDGSA
jgi:hypothetical protein